MTEYHSGGPIPGTVDAQLQEGESIIDRNGNVVATVIDGKLVRVRTVLKIDNPSTGEYKVVDEAKLQRFKDNRYSGYKCGRCRGGPTGMLGHYTMYCQVINKMLKDHHFCCPDDCRRESDD